jgi:hypothetical protein
MNASARSNTLRLSRRDFTAGLRLRPYATGILASFWFIEHLTAF